MHNLFILFIICSVNKKYNNKGNSEKEIKCILFTVYPYSIILKHFVVVEPV